MSTRDNDLEDEAALVLPEPIGLQPEILADPSSRKVLRFGRRGTKTRLGFLAAVCGHGPGWTENAPALPGILQGGDVVWVSSDYPNLISVLWNELIVPRFGSLPWATLNKNEHTLALQGLGTLYLRPETAIGGIRGMGANLSGVIGDEAAHWNVGAALKEVILPALMDRRGWLVLMSTTNLGWDGNSERELPSFFNRLCAEIRDGRRGSEWHEWTGTAYDNPSLDRAGIDELVAEYDQDSIEFRQEILAELLTGGAGLALPSATTALLTTPFPIPTGWPTFGAFDWGYNHPFAFGAFTKSPDGVVYLTHAVTGRHLVPDQIAAAVAAHMDVRTLAYIVGGTDCWNSDQAKGVKVPSIADQLMQKGWKLTPIAQGGGRPRAQRLDNLRRACGWGTPGTQDHVPARFHLFDHGPGREVLRALAGTLLDPNDPEVPLKVDADSRGRGGDDWYDMVSYALASTPAPVRAPTVVFADDRTPGYDYTKHQPRPRLSADEEVAQMLRRANVAPTALRHRVPRR